MFAKLSKTKIISKETIRRQDNYQIKENLLIKIIYNCKKATTNNIYFYLIFFILKIVGLLILSHNYIRLNSQKDFSIKSILRLFTYFRDFNSTILNINMINYQTYCFIILLFCIIPLLGIFLIHKILFSKNSKIVKIPKKLKILLRIFSVMISMVVFLSQYLIEILSYIFVHFFMINYSNSLIASKTEATSILQNNLLPIIFGFEESLKLGNYFFIAINSFSILLINILVYYYFIFVNEPYLNSQSSIKLNDNKSFLFFLILSFNLQALHYVEFIFKDIFLWNFRLGILIVTFFINTNLIFNIFRNYNFQTFYNKFLQFIFALCFISCILDVIVYYSYKDYVDTTHNIFKFVIEIFLAIILIYTINEIKWKRYTKILNANIFSKNKNINLYSLCFFTDLIQNSLGESVNFLPVFNMIDNHKSKCLDEDCACIKYEFKNYLKNFELNRELKFLTDEDKLNCFKKLYNDIITLTENEIVNSIHQFYKRRELNKNFDYFILHFDFIFHFKRNYLFSNYLIEQYLVYLKDLPFDFKFHFYTYKKSLQDYHFDHIKINSTMNINLNYLEFHKYHKILMRINKFIFKNCENFENLILIKKTFDNNNLANYSRDKSFDFMYLKVINNIENIFNLCEKLNKNYNQLCNYLEINFKTERLRNIEMSYLLFNFFILINKEIPQDVSYLFLHIESYGIIESYSSSYGEKKIYHPVLLNTNKFDNFVIKYISQKLCDLIEYKKNELIDEDIHILIPRLIVDQHKTIMRKLIFLEFDSKIKKETFLVTKNKHYLGIHMTSTFLPTINNNCLIIMDIFPLVENTNNKILSYKFILDLNTNFITYTKNFQENFYINFFSFKKLRINFCQFFNINFNQLSEKFKPALDYIQKIDLTPTNNITKIFENVDLIKALEFLNEDNKASINFNIKNSKFTKNLDFLRKKEKLITTLIKIKKKMQEAEMNIEELNKINELEKKFYRHTSTNKMLSLRKVVSKSLNINKNNSNFSSDDIGDVGIDQFYIRFNLFNIGNIPYFFVQLFEQKETVMDFTQLKQLQMSFGLQEIPNTTSFIGETNISEIIKFDIPTNSITESNKDGNNHGIGSTINLNPYNHLFTQNTSANHLFLNSNSQNNLNKDINIYNKVTSNFLGARESKLNLILGAKNSNNNTFNFNSSIGGNLNQSNNDSIQQLMQKTSEINGSSILNFNNNTILTENKTNSTKIELKSINQFSSITKKVKKIIVKNKKSNTENLIQKTLFIFLFILLTIQIFLSFFNFYFKNNISNNTFQLFNVNYYAYLTEVSILYASSTVLTACSNVEIDPKNIDKFSTNISDYQEKFKLKSTDLLTNLYKFMNFLSTSDPTQISEIMPILTEQRKFKLLYADWTSYYRNSNILDEMSYYHYYIAGLQKKDSFKMCRLKQYFFYETFDKFKNNTSFSNVNNEESVLYYIAYNIFNNFGKNFQLITFKLNNILIDYLNKSLFTLIIFNLVILFFGVALIITIIISIRNYRTKILKIIFNIFIKHKRDQNFEEKLINYKTIVIDLDKNICCNFEENIKRLNFKENSVIDYNPNSQSPSKKEFFFKGKNSKGNKTSDPSQTTKQKLKIKNLNKTKTTSIKTKEETEKSEESVSQNTIDIGRISIKIVKLSYLILFISLMCYLSMTISNIFVNNRDYKKLILANQISLNFLERIPKFMELILYFKISVIFNNTNFIVTPYEEYQTTQNSNYYDVKYDTTSDAIFKELNTSEYNHIYFNLKIIRKNIYLFMGSQNEINSGVLSTLRDFENKINSQDFCNSHSNFYIKNFFTCKNLYECFKSLNQEAVECQTIGNGINKYGLNLAMDSLLSNTNNLYIDFQRAKSSGDIIKTLTDIGFLRSVMDVENTFQKLNNSYLKMILEEMTNLYSSIKNIELIYCIVGLFFNFCFILFVIFGVINKLQKYYISLACAIDKFKIALISKNIEYEI